MIETYFIAPDMSVTADDSKLAEQGSECALILLAAQSFCAPTGEGIPNIQHPWASEVCAGGDGQVQRRSLLPGKPREWRVLAAGHLPRGGGAHH